MAATSSLSKDARPAVLPAAEGLATELEALARLDLAGLRVQYRNRTGRIAPTRISRPLLLHVLAYRIQADAFGDLSRDTRRRLERLSASPVLPVGEQDVARPTTVDAPVRLMPGTLLSREWQGRMERVMVLEKGFAWNGAPFSSLSALALAITGTKWNGYRFFGLRDQKIVVALTEDRAPANRTPKPKLLKTSCVRTSAAGHGRRPVAGGRP